MASQALAPLICAIKDKMLCEAAVWISVSSTFRNALWFVNNYTENRFGYPSQKWRRSSLTWMTNGIDWREIHLGEVHLQVNGFELSSAL